MRSRAHAGVAQRGDGEAHHDLGPAQHRHRVLRVEGRALDQAGDHADVAVPGPGRVIDRDLDVQVEPAPQRLELAPVEDLLRAARAVQQDQLP